MPVYQLDENLIFPHPHLARKDGLLAIGGDLSSERLLLAYENGIFPWYSKGEPLLWWSPDPRCVVFPEDLKISKSMKTLLNGNRFEVTINKNFAEVVQHCSEVKRKGQNGTWITKEMIEAYQKLHQKEKAISVEVWENEILVGGLYGILIRNCFCGESMFSKVSNASKFGFITFAQYLFNNGIKLIDCQTTTSHLVTLGAKEIQRDKFLHLLKEG